MGIWWDWGPMAALCLNCPSEWVYEWRSSVYIPYLSRGKTERKWWNPSLVSALSIFSHVARHMPVTALPSEVPRDLIFSLNGSVWVTRKALRRWWPIYLGENLRPWTKMRDALIQVPWRQGTWLFFLCSQTDAEIDSPVLWPPNVKEEPAHWKRPWCWERLRARGEAGDRRWDGWMTSLTQGTWVWANASVVRSEGQGSLACCSP